MTGGGSRIFVPREGNAKINLKEGDFLVLDANGTDGSAAFQLPNPDPDNDGTTTYSVFARALRRVALHLQETAGRPVGGRSVVRVPGVHAAGQPAAYGIDYVAMTGYFQIFTPVDPADTVPKPTPEWMVVSATNRAGVYLEQDPFAGFRDIPAAHVIANHLYVYPAPAE